MFDINFTEMVVIGVVALIVIGPEKLPRVARTVGILLGRVQRYVNDVKSDINKQIQIDEVRQLQELQQQVVTQAREIETSIQQDIKDAKVVEEELYRGIEPPAPAVPSPPTPEKPAV